VHIAYAAYFFVYVGLCETFRQGYFGFSPSEIELITYGLLAVGAVAFLNTDVPSLLRQPRRALYGRPGLNWTWGRSALALLAAAAIVLALGMAAQTWRPEALSLPLSNHILATILPQVVLVTLVEALFLREAAIKVARDSRIAIYILSGLATLVFFMPAGPQAAAAGMLAGLMALTIRLMGVNLLGVVLIHSAVLVLLQNVIDLSRLIAGTSLARDPDTLAAGAVFAAAAFIYYGFIASRRRFTHA